MKKDVWTILSESDKPLVLYGTGDGADKILNVMEEKGITAAGVFASDGFVRQRQFRGMPVLSYADAREQFGDMLVVVAFASSRPEVIANMARLNRLPIRKILPGSEPILPMRNPAVCTIACWITSSPAPSTVC